MKKRFLLLVIFITFIISSISFVLIINYLDPYEYMILAFLMLIISFILWVSSFFTLILYLFKKVYFRWNVYVDTILSSFRQSFFISLFFIGLLIFNYMWVWILLMAFLLFVFLLFIELLIQNLTS